jgi:hypothetical protein
MSQCPTSQLEFIEVIFRFFMKKEKKDQEKICSVLLEPACPKGDILTLLEKGHFNFAQSGDILTLP